MRAIFVLLFLASPALADGITPYPNIPMPQSSDAEGWTIFCGGFFNEIKRQAIEVDNRLQFDDVTDKISKNGSAFIVMTVNGQWNISDADFYAWVSAGQKKAGSEIWDIPATAGGFDMKDWVRAMRRPIESQCANVATKNGLLYQAQADLIQKRLAGKR